MDSRSRAAWGLILTAALAGCGGPQRRADAPRASSSGGRPDWVAGQSSRYPRSAYVVGVGRADSREAAQERARGEISKIFSSVVTVQSEFTDAERTVNQDGKTKTSFAQALSESVQNVSQTALEGVEIADNWQDPESRQHAALAVLGRAKAQAALRDKVEDIDRQAASWKGQMETAGSSLARVKASMKILALFKARDQLNAQYRVLDAAGASLANPLDAAGVRTRASKALADLDVHVALPCASEEGLCGPEVESGVIEGLTALGLTAKTKAGAGSADVLVEGEVSPRPQEGRGDSWKWARTSVTVGLLDGQTGKVFLRFDASDRQASVDVREAARRSRVELGKKVAGQVHDAIVRYFENQ